MNLKVGRCKERETQCSSREVIEPKNWSLKNLLYVFREDMSVSSIQSA